MSRVMSEKEAQAKAGTDVARGKFDPPTPPIFSSKEEQEQTAVVREVYKEAHILKEKELKKR